MTAEMLDIKVLKIHRLSSESRIKAFVDLTVNGVLLIKGIRVIQGKSRMFVAMPMEQGKNEKWYERVRCLDNGLRSIIARKVLDAYKL